MRALITGCCGFVGSHLADKLAELGYEIIGIDDFSSNVVHSIPGDLINKEMTSVDLSEIPKVDVIFHLADKVGPLSVISFAGKMAISTIENVKWAINLALRDDAVLVAVSTSEVYGKIEGRTYLKEDDVKVFSGEWTPRTEYACSKLLAEMLIVNTGKTTNLRYSICRPFNIAGQRQRIDGGFVLPRFLDQASKGEPITCYIPGTQRRSFTYVGDVCSALILISKTDRQNEIWNIGNKNNESTIMELAEMVKDETKTSSPIVIVDPKELHGPLFFEAPDKICDSSKLESLGWKPTLSIREVIRLCGKK